MTEPIELLKQRLLEINSVKYNSREMIDYRNMYISAIRFLKLNGFHKYSSKNLTKIDIASIITMRKNKVSVRFIAIYFGVSTTTIRKYLKLNNHETI